MQVKKELKKNLKSTLIMNLISDHDYKNEDPEESIGWDGLKDREPLKKLIHEDGRRAFYTSNKQDHLQNPWGLFCLLLMLSEMQCEDPTGGERPQVHEEPSNAWRALGCRRFHTKISIVVEDLKVLAIQMMKNSALIVLICSYTTEIVENKTIFTG